jgi:hypothetical protein
LKNPPVIIGGFFLPLNPLKGDFLIIGGYHEKYWLVKRIHLTYELIKHVSHIFTQRLKFFKIPFRGI